MEKRNNAYQLELKEVSLKNGDAGTKSLHLNTILYKNFQILYKIVLCICSNILSF